MSVKDWWPGRGRTNANTLQRLASAQHNTLTTTPARSPTDSTPTSEGHTEKERWETPNYTLNDNDLAERSTLCSTAAGREGGQCDAIQRCSCKCKCLFSIIAMGIFQLFLHVLSQRLPKNILRRKPKRATHLLHSTFPTVSIEVCILHCRQTDTCNSWWPEAWEGASGAPLQRVS